MSFMRRECESYATGEEAHLHLREHARARLLTCARCIYTRYWELHFEEVKETQSPNWLMEIHKYLLLLKITVLLKGEFNQFFMRLIALICAVLLCHVILNKITFWVTPTKWCKSWNLKLSSSVISLHLQQVVDCDPQKHDFFVQLNPFLLQIP